MEEIEALVKAERSLKKKDNEVFVMKEKEKQEPKPKQKRHYSDAQKEAMIERLRLAREKAQKVKEMKGTIKEVVKEEHVEEFNERSKKFAEKSINEKLEIIEKKKQEQKTRTYNRPAQEIKQVKAEQPKVEQPKVEQPKVEPKAEPKVEPAQVQPVQPVQVQPVQVQPVQPQLKYYMPTKSYYKKHNLFNLV